MGKTKLRPYVVRQGDYLARIAFQCGFDEAEVWAAEENRELRESRGDGQILLPGDVVYVPERESTPARLALAAQNAYEGVVPSIAVNLVLREEGQPLASEKCLVLGLGDPRELVTNTGGGLTIEAPLTATELGLEVVRTGAFYRIAVGYLDPPDSPSGIRGRLSNLGYLGPPAAGEPNEVEGPGELETAIRRFQASIGSTVTGEQDEETIKALADAHGA